MPTKILQKYDFCICRHFCGINLCWFCIIPTIYLSYNESIVKIPSMRENEGTLIMEVAERNRKGGKISIFRIPSFVSDCESSTLYKVLIHIRKNLDRDCISAVLHLRGKQVQFSCSYRKFVQALIGLEDNPNSQGGKILTTGEWYGVYKVWIFYRPWKSEHIF